MSVIFFYWDHLKSHIFMQNADWLKLKEVSNSFMLQRPCTEPFQHLHPTSQMEVGPWMGGHPREKWIFPWLGLSYCSSWHTEDNSISSNHRSFWARSLGSESGIASPRCFKLKRKWGHGSSSPSALELARFRAMADITNQFLPWEGHAVCVSVPQRTHTTAAQATATSTCSLGHVPIGILIYLLQLYKDIQR